MKKTCELPLGRLPELQWKLDKFSKRAAKLGLPPLTYTVERQYAKGVTAYGTVTVEGPAPVIPGWTLVAAIDRIESDVVLLTIPGQTVDFEKWKSVGSYCDHCHTLRNRNRTYLLRDALGKEMQLGSTCVLAFTGADLEGLFSFCLDWTGSVGEGWESGGSGVLWMESYLGAVAAVIQKFGWVSRKMADEKCLRATADEALDFFAGERPKHLQGLAVTDAHDELAAETLKWARETLVPKTDYEHNLKVILGKESLPLKFVGFAASGIVAYQRFLADAAKRDADKQSQFVGEVGKRQVFENLTVIFTKDFPGQFGTTTLAKFRDPAGNILVWFGSAIAEAMAVWETGPDGKKFSQRCLKAGDVVKAMKATVKEHSEYQSVRQTTITRAKLA